VGETDSLGRSAQRLAVPWANVAQVLEERVAEALPRIFRQGGGLGIAENLHRLLCGVDDNAAVFAILEMLFDGGF